jgi:hypothetical protein
MRLLEIPSSETSLLDISNTAANTIVSEIDYSSQSFFQLPMAVETCLVKEIAWLEQSTCPALS